MNDDIRTWRMHRARDKEIELIFSGVPAKAFERGLELGAGDCYQSRFLRKYVSKLTCTDFSYETLQRNDDEITYKACDVEQIGNAFGNQEFDLIFSSNVLHHTPDPHTALNGIAAALKDDGVTIHVVVNPCWKITKLFLFYPRLLLDFPSRLLRKLSKETETPYVAKGKRVENNPKTNMSWPHGGGAFFQLLWDHTKATSKSLLLFGVPSGLVDFTQPISKYLKS